MEILTYDSANLLNEGYKVLINRKKCMIYSEADLPFICAPRKGVVDEQLCYDLGYRVYEMLHGGGVIVVEPGDIDIAHFGDNDNTFRHEFATDFAKWLRSNGLNPIYEDNDILVDGYKVCGIGMRRHGDIDYTTIHIGINTNLEHIKLICKKPMNKVPKGLSEYGITTEEVEAWFLDFAERNQ